jgi:integrase
MHQITTINYFNTDIVNFSIQKANDFMEQHVCKNSKRSYESDILFWKYWIQKIGLSDISEIKKEYLIAFIMEHVEIHKISTIKRRIASLSRFLHFNNLPNPCYDKDIIILVKKLTEKYGFSKAWGKAITLEILNLLLETCVDDGLKGIRDSALLLFGFSTGGRRRSEISSATCENLIKNNDGNYIYNLNKSKTNKIGENDPKPLLGRAAMALTYWLKTSGINKGPIFRGISKSEKINENEICDKQISRIVKDRAKKAGLDPSDYTAHSLRSGFVTESGKRGKPIGDIMSMTGHRSLKEVMRYYQSGNILNNSTAYLAG